MCNQNKYNQEQQLRPYSCEVFTQLGHKNQLSKGCASTATINRTHTDPDMGGGIWPPPLPKIPGKCPMGRKLGRVPQRGLNIKFKPKKYQPSAYGCHKGIMKIPPYTVFCHDFAEYQELL